MKTKIEGLLIFKIPHKERDLIGHLLLRSGKKVSILFYGGQGGGSKKKTSGLELGHMLKIEVQIPKKKGPIDLYSSREWEIIWWHSKIRPQYFSFCLMCFYLEVLQKVSWEEKLCESHYDEVDHHQNEGLFAVLSNAIYLLENAEVSQIKQDFQLAFFMAKILFELGLYPELKECLFCSKSLPPNGEGVFFVREQGAFSCLHCHNHPKSDQNFYYFLRWAQGVKFREITLGELEHRSILDLLIAHFCYQNNFHKQDFRSLASISKSI